jgi:hypothetical protein
LTIAFFWFIIVTEVQTEGDEKKMEINLEQERKSLEARISNLQSRMAPIQKELKELRERLCHVNALIPVEPGMSVSLPYDKLEWSFWVKLCRENNWPVGGDSAHRVVRRKDPQLHSSIPHQCKYDGKMYP